MTPTRLAWAAIATAGLIAISVWATTPPAGEHADLHDRIAAQAVRVGDGGEFVLADVTDFEWDRVHVFDAYSVAGDVERELGRSPMSPAGRFVFGYLLLAQDGLQLLAFVRDDEVIAWTVLNEANMERTAEEQQWVRFELARQIERFERASATFTVGISEGIWRLDPTRR